MQLEDGEMQPKSSIRIPVKVSPGLPGGDVHRLEADSEKVQIVTWQGVYGNRESRVVLKIPFPQIIDIRCVSRQLLPDTTCHIRYRDTVGEERKLRLRVFDQESHSWSGQRRGNVYTEAMAEALKSLRQGKKAVFPSLNFKPSSSMRKLLTAGVLIGAIVSFAALKTGDNLAALGLMFRFLGSLLFSASLSALGIDYVRMHTGWHPVVKAFSYVVLTLAAFVLFVALATLFFEILE